MSLAYNPFALPCHLDHWVPEPEVSYYYLHSVLLVLSRSRSLVSSHFRRSLLQRISVELT